MHSFCSPLSISAPFYGYLKLLKLRRMVRSRSKDVWSGNRTWDLLHKGRALTDCVILAPQSSLNSSKFTLNKNEKFSYITFNNSFKPINFCHICFTAMERPCEVRKTQIAEKLALSWHVTQSYYGMLHSDFVLNFQSPTHVRWVMVIAAIFVC